jgi:putative hydrolase of the HAD superfamily
MTAPGEDPASAPGRTGIRGVLFDFGGVLSTSPFGAFESYEHDHELPAGFIRGVNATNPDRNAWACLERNEIDFDEFCDRIMAEAVAAGGSIDGRDLFSRFQGRLHPEMIEAVRRCRRHFRVGVLSNTFVGPMATERTASVADLFDVFIESARTGVRKPDPRAYVLACEALGTEPSATVFLDDIGTNLKPARALGMHTIKVVEPRSALIELQGVLGIELLGDVAQETGA